MAAVTPLSNADLLPDTGFPYPKGRTRPFQPDPFGEAVLYAGWCTRCGHESRHGKWQNRNHIRSGKCDQDAARLASALAAQSANEEDTQPSSSGPPATAADVPATHTQPTQLRAFGNEDWSAIEDEVEKAVLLGRRGVRMLVLKLYFNKAHPENMTVRWDNDTAFVRGYIKTRTTDGSFQINEADRDDLLAIMWFKAMRQMQSVFDGWESTNETPQRFAKCPGRLEAARAFFDNECCITDATGVPKADIRALRRTVLGQKE